MEERRLLLAVALSLLVLTAYQFLFAPPPVSRPSSGGPSTTTPGARPVTAESAAPSPFASPTPGPQATPVASVADERERRVEVQGQEVAVAFANRGARLVSWRLVRFHDAAGRPEEMVQTLAEGPRALDLETGDEGLDKRLREALFVPSAESVVLAPRTDAELSFRYAEGDVEVEKALRFREPGYLVAVRASVVRGGRRLPTKVLWGPGIGNPTAAEKEVQGYQPPHAVYASSDGVVRIAPEKLGGVRTIAQARWGGVESTHFAALWIPPSAPGSVELRAVDVPAPAAGTKALAPVVAVPLEGPEAALLYVGPKDHALLTRTGHHLVDVVPVGEWIGPLVVPMMGLLRWVNSWVGNYGWSIVVLTVLINAVMAPLRHYSIANGMKMAKLSPEMKVIQERYRKVPALDPKRQEMQKEIGELYARHGMSMGTQMLVGCLPLLLTMPFLIAFYRVLTLSIELRGERFLWIPDLSQRDPIFLTPLLMGATMFLTQKMTPTTMDPAQQRIMMMMPVVLAVMFHAAPSGLNLYWLVANVCAIVQQGVTLRLLRSPEDTARANRRRP